MRGKGIPVDHFYPKRCSGTGSSSARSSQGKRKSVDDVVIIDVDDDSFNNVIVDDVHENLQHESQGNFVREKGNTSAFENVISIDDDESNVINHSRAGLDGNGDLESDATSSKTSCPVAACSSRDSVGSSDDECQIIEEKTSIPKMSNCGKDSGRVASCSNRYGLHSDSESDSSDSDCSDCEIVEDSHGKLREQWENASRRKRNQSGVDDRGSASYTPSDGYQNPSEGKKSMQHSGANIFSSASNSCGEKENLAAFAKISKGNFGAASLNREVETHLDSDHKYKDIDMSGANSGSSAETVTCRKHNSLFENEKFTEGHHPSNEQRHRCRSELGGSASPCKDSFDAGETHQSEMKTCHESLFNEKNANDDEIAFSKRQCTVETSGDSVGDVFKHSLSPNTQFSGKNEVSNSGNCQGSDRPVDPGSCLEKVNESVTDSVSACKQHDDRDILHGHNRVATPHNLADPIVYRESLKETDEYKRAMEEEWASRQEQLRIQAEEAQRLRKKKRAESMRLLEMERRQKQRVEEIRDSQKKVEENMNLKEQLRGLVRKELNQLEMKCSNMAALLRGLGIQVGGGMHPSSHEVHAAYKRALLKFHPDRASRSDIRQQVEAEEKFKLISRMKEKVLSAQY